MNKKFIPYLILIGLAVLTILIKKCKESNQPQPNPKTTTTGSKKTGSTDRERGFDRRTSFLEYSKHAKCRMECRHITQSEVEQVMKDGKINYNKSDLQNARCPRYAIEGLTEDHQEVRIIFAQCNEKTEVVTVIDLDTDWTCHCPGDNKN